MPLQYIPDAFQSARVEENFIQCGKKQWLPLFTGLQRVRHAKFRPRRQPGYEKTER